MNKPQQPAEVLGVCGNNEDAHIRCSHCDRWMPLGIPEAAQDSPLGTCADVPEPHAPAPQQGQTEPHWSDKLTIGFDIYDDEPEYKPQTEPQEGKSEPDTFDAIDRAMEIEMLQPRCPNCNAPIGPPAKPQDDPKRPDVEAAQDSPKGLVLPPLDEGDQDLYSKASGEFNDRWPNNIPYDTSIVREIWAKLRRERQLMDCIRRAIEAEERVQELEECLIVAGTVRDASYPSGWRNFRAESAEAKVQELQKQIDAANGTTEGR